MEKVVRVFESLADAEQADLHYYASLTPEQRLEIMVQLLDLRTTFHDGASDRLERVYRVVELKLR